MYVTDLAAVAVAIAIIALLLGIVAYIIQHQKKLCREYRRVLTVLWILFGFCYIVYAHFLCVQNSIAEYPLIDSIFTNAFSVLALLVLQGLIKTEEKRKCHLYFVTAVVSSIVLYVLICCVGNCESGKGDVLAITLLMPIIVGAGGELIHQFLKCRFGVKDR